MIAPVIEFIKSVFSDTKLLLAGLYVEVKLKKQNYKMKYIQDALQSRINDYNNNLSHMIDSILNRKKKVISFDICLNNSNKTTHNNKEIPEE